MFWDFASMILFVWNTFPFLTVPHCCWNETKFNPNSSPHLKALQELIFSQLSDLISTFSLAISALFTKFFTVSNFPYMLFSLPRRFFFSFIPHQLLYFTYFFYFHLHPPGLISRIIARKIFKSILTLDQGLYYMFSKHSVICFFRDFITVSNHMHLCDF